VTHLRKIMLEELQRRNYAKDTTRFYIRTVEDFSRRFNQPPDRLGPRHIREYQAELFQKRKLSPGTVAHPLSALRFFYIKTLRSERDRCLPPPLATSPPRHRQSFGLAAAERQISTGGIDGTATPGGGRSRPLRGNRFHRTQPQLDRLEAHQSAAGHCTLSYRRSWRAYR
jgi:Phage integrase, N-terminal SAM-like domain